MSSSFVVRRAEWNRDREDLRQIRETVFVQEQLVPQELEWDGLDEACIHVLAVDRSGVPIGTGRLLPDGHIGRMAVLPAWRRRGVGAALLSELTRVALGQGLVEVILNAQVQAMGFYLRHGFAPEGEEFLDAGIPHRRMRRALA